MTTLSRWSLALTSGAAALAGAAFVAQYSAIERNNAEWQDLALPIATEWFVRLAPFALGLAALFLAGNMIAAWRRHDSALFLITSFAWLFAFTWVLACLLVWRMPYILIGSRLSP